MKYAKEFLDIELKDDCTSEGGTSFQGETLKDFLEEESIPFSTPIRVVNQYLISCGIQPIEEHLDTVKWVEDKLSNYMGNNQKVALSKGEAKKLFDSFLEGFFANNEVLETDLDHLYEINNQLWEVSLVEPINNAINRLKGLK